LRFRHKTFGYLLYISIACVTLLDSAKLMWLSQRYNSLTFELIFHKSVQPRYLLLTCILETNVVSLPSVVHLGLQLVCVTVDVAEAGNTKLSRWPRKIPPQFSGVPRCRATCRIPHRGSRHSRKSRLNTPCSPPWIAIINS